MNIVKAKTKDAYEIVDFFHKYPETSYCDWQDVNSTKNILKQDTSIVLILYIQNNIEGVLFGGIMGSRGTINHLAISDTHRGKGLAKQLYYEFEESLLKKNIKRLFLFTDKLNSNAISFWSKLNFKNINSEVTLEKDV